MSGFLAALAVFILAHAIPALPAVRHRLVLRLGRGGYVFAYSLLSLALFTLLIASALAAPYIALWTAPRWAYAVPLVGMLLAAALLGASLTAPNPLSIAFVGSAFEPERPGAVALTRHPILWGLALWGLSHVPPNGDLVALILFGSLGLFALLGIWIMEQRRPRALGRARWEALAGPTSVLPFAALVTGRAHWPRDARTLVGGFVGVAAYLALLAGLHAWLFGADPLAVW